ncbi:MAG TPA: hypothetical protein VF826_12205 [Chloroflexia bacterium]|jgi:hypothetical protein
MSQATEFPLRDFVYLDTVKLQSFSSVIQGGIATEVSARIKSLGELSGGIDIGLMQFRANIGASKGQEHERMQTLSITDPVLFDGLYKALRQSNQLKPLEEVVTTATGVPAPNLVVEAKGTAGPPVLEEWLERLHQMLELLKKFGAALGATSNPGRGSTGGKAKGRPTVAHPAQMIKQFESIADLLADYVNLAQTDPGREYIRVRQGQSSIWCGLLPEFIVAPKADFSAEVTVIGQIDKLLGPNETWKLVDLSKFGDTQTADKLLAALNSMPMGLGQITEQDLQAQHPDVFIRPIAIYK